MKQIIKVKFLRNDQPSGRAYTYFSEEEVKVGDSVQINSQAKGIVTEVDIPEVEIESFKHLVKFIHGKATEEKE